MKQQAEITMRSTDKLMNKTMPVMNPLSTINKNPLDHNILIKHLTIEFEVRRSNITDFYARDELPTVQTEIRLDHQNIFELQNSGELDQDSSLQFEVISKDMRCFKTRTKQKEVNYYLEKTVP
jgi:hypothetical protein